MTLPCSEQSRVGRWLVACRYRELLISPRRANQRRPLHEGYGLVSSHSNLARWAGVNCQVARRKWKTQTKEKAEANGATTDADLQKRLRQLYQVRSAPASVRRQIKSTNHKTKTGQIELKTNKCDLTYALWVLSEHGR